MGKEEDNLRIERIRQVIDKKLEQIRELETELRRVRQQIAELQFIAGDSLEMEPRDERRRPPMSEEAKTRISVAAKKRWAKVGKHKKGAGVANFRTDWTPEEDQLIIDYAASNGPIGIVDAAKKLLSKLKGRSEGAIRQRAYKLGMRGKVKVHKSKSGAHGGMPMLIMERAA